MDSKFLERITRLYQPMRPWQVLEFKRYPYGKGPNADGSIPGEFRVRGRTWPTIETSGNYTFVRKGIYLTTMDLKNTGEHVQCLRFDEDPSIQTHLIHRAYNDDHRPGKSLTGCIAPGLARRDNGSGIIGSVYAMEELFRTLGGFEPGRKVIVAVENNVRGRGWDDETKEEWINRRRKKKGLPPRDDL